MPQSGIGCTGAAATYAAPPSHWHRQPLAERPGRHATCGVVPRVYCRQKYLSIYLSILVPK